MRLLLASSSPPDRGSGINTYAKELSEALIKLGHEVHYLSPSPNDFSWLDDLGIRHVASERVGNQIEAAKKLISYIKANCIEGAINNDNSLLQSISPALGIPIVVIGHFNARSIASLACYRHEWSDYIVAISNDMHKIFVKKYHVPITKCPIIHNGINDRLNDGKIGLVNDKLQVTYANGFNKSKGGDLILKAATLSPESWKNIVLNIFGTLPVNIKRSLLKYPHVKYFGRLPREDYLNYLRKSDVLLLPSRLEGCPMTMLEAMSFGVVPVASDGAGAMRWLVDSGVDGYICHLDSWSRQALKILSFLRDNPEVLLKLKNNARKHFLEHHQMSACANKLIDLIKSPVVNRNKIPSSFKVLKWHRPLRSDGKKSPFLYRISFRYGILFEEGTYSNV